MTEISERLRSHPGMPASEPRAARPSVRTQPDHGAADRPDRVGGERDPATEHSEGAGRRPAGRGRRAHRRPSVSRIRPVRVPRRRADGHGFVERPPGAHLRGVPRPPHERLAPRPVGSGIRRRAPGRHPGGAALRCSEGRARQMARKPLERRSEGHAAGTQRPRPPGRAALDRAMGGGRAGRDGEERTAPRRLRSTRDFRDGTACRSSSPSVRPGLARYKPFTMS